MGFRVKIAPGVRVGVSSRGVRASFGPQAARVHVGAGKTGVSTGVGPVSYYTSLGVGRRAPQRGGGRAGGAGSTSLCQYERDIRSAQRGEELLALAARFVDLYSVHREDFPPARPPLPPPATPLDEAEIRGRHAAEQLLSIPPLSIVGRRAARARAAELAAAEIARETKARQILAAEEQRSLDEAWRLLCGNDQDTVFRVVEAAFADNEVPAVPINSEGSHLSVLMLAPSPAVVPDRFPERTATGLPRLRHLSLTERNICYAQMVSSHALATVREAFAVAPGIATVDIVVARRTESGLDVVLMAGFKRARLETADWDESALDILAQTPSSGDVNISDRDRELLPVDLSSEPDVAELLAELHSHLAADAAEEPARPDYRISATTASPLFGRTAHLFERSDQGTRRPAEPQQRVGSPGWYVGKSLWILPTILFMGLGTWASFLYLGLKTKSRTWLTWAAAWAAWAVAFFTVASIVVEHDNIRTGPETARTVAAITMWVVGAVQVFAANITWLRSQAHAARIDQRHPAGLCAEPPATKSPLDPAWSHASPGEELRSPPQRIRLLESTMTVPFGHQKANVVYRPDRMTFSMWQKADKALGARDHATLVGLLVELIVDWDVKQHGRAVPISRDSLRKLPRRFVKETFLHIMADAYAKNGPPAGTPVVPSYS